MRHYCLAILLIYSSSGISVQGFEDSEEGSSTDALTQKVSLDNYISFAWENDLYFQRDYYYTNGFQIEFFHDKLQQSPINRILIPFRNKRKGITWSGLHLSQEIFTPRDLAVDSISTGDHPYSSTLTIAQNSVFVLPDKQLRLVSGLRVGVLGPASLGFKTQELAHLVSNPSRSPQGWDYQVRNDLIINYDLKAEKGLIDQKNALFGVLGMGRLGTLHTDLEAGLWFMFDARNGYFQRLGPTGGPGLNVVFSFSASASYVFYDATLQGGVINRSSPYIVAPDQMMRWLGNLEGNLTFELYQHQLEFYTQISTPRFQLAKGHAWMGIAYKYWF